MAYPQSPTTSLFVQQLVQADKKSPHYWPLPGKSTDDQRIAITNGQQCFPMAWHHNGVTRRQHATIDLFVVLRFHYHSGNEQYCCTLGKAQAVRHSSLYITFFMSHLTIVTIRLKVGTLNLFEVKPWINDTSTMLMPYFRLITDVFLPRHSIPY